MSQVQQPKTLIVLFGPAAVGKTAVGY